MSKSVEVIINQKTFKLGFGLEVFLTLGDLWGFDTLEEVNERFATLGNLETGKTSLSNMKVMSEIAEAMIAGHVDNKDFITAKEIRCLDIKDFEKVILAVVNGFSQNLPRPDTDNTADNEKKPNTRASKKSL